MTKKDYELIASVLKSMQFNVIDGNEWDGGASDYEVVCNNFATALKEKNDQFNTSMFLATCGIEV